MSIALSSPVEGSRSPKPSGIASRSRWEIPRATVGWLLATGIALRAWHYLRAPSIWLDEAALVVNVLGKEFKELLGPLLFSEAAPPLLLWIERAMATAFGDGLYALRFVPFAASCAALVLMAPLAQRALRAGAAPWAVFLFALSDRLLWHSCEAKPYATDVLAATAILFLLVTMRRGPLVRQLLVYAALAPPVIFLSYPGCFVYGGLLAALLPAVWRSRRLSAWSSYGLLVLSVFTAFGLLAVGPVKAQRDARIVDCWEGMDKFPPRDRPSMIPSWTLLSTVSVASYGWRPAGEALVPLAVIGVFSLWRRGQRELLAAMLVPILLPLAASFFRAYPYGGTRVLAYACPAVVLLVAEGVPPAMAWLGARNRLGVVLLLAILATPVARAAWRTVCPWPRPDSAGAAAYVLQDRRSTDPVTGNYWDYRYLFRHLGAAFTPLEELPEPRGGRWWVVLSSRIEEELRDGLKPFPPAQWQILEHHEFLWTGVFLFEQRPSPRPALAGALCEGARAIGEDWHPPLAGRIPLRARSDERDDDWEETGVVRPVWLRRQSRRGLPVLSKPRRIDRLLRHVSAVGDIL